jgi:hypothetical protein
LIPRERPGDAGPSRPATRAALALLAAAILAGCSGLAATNEEAPASGPDPSYRDVIASRLKAAFKERASSYDSFEISEPRWVHWYRGWNWLTCVRFQDHGHRRTYALFFNATAVVDDRYAVQTDDCDRQDYAPFEKMGGRMGLDPLH